LVQHTDHGLGSGEVSGAQQDEYAVAGAPNTVIQNLAMLSMPAFVRESEAKINPFSSITPMQ
jgi:hypothetical protein